MNMEDYFDKLQKMANPKQADDRKKNEPSPDQDSKSSHR
jgi:hypothetical protein